MKIVIDTREQQPLSFAGLPVEAQRGTLSAGDYALALVDGTADRGFAIERKSLSDFAGTVSTGWERFQRELGRMEGAGFPARVIVVEGSVTGILDHDYNHPKVEPHFLLARVAELTLDGVSVLFADNRAAAAGLVWKLLAHREKQLRMLAMTDAVMGLVNDSLVEAG